MTIVMDLEPWQIYALLGVGGFLTYMLMASFTAFLFVRACGVGDVEDATFCGLIWPASLPILLLFLIGYCLVFKPIYWTTELLKKKG